MLISFYFFIISFIYILYNKCLIQDIFEIVFCYFPITFKAPPGNIIKITTEDLKHALK